MRAPGPFVKEAPVWRRILVAGCGAGLVLAALSGCGSSQPQPGGTPSSITITTSPGASAPGSGAPGSPTSAGPARPPAEIASTCSGTQVSVAQPPGGQGAAGTVVVAITVTNTSTTACALTGYPDFQLTAHSASMATDFPENVIVRHGGMGGSAFGASPTTVPLAPGGKAGFQLAYPNHPQSGNGGCDVATKLHLRLAGGTETVGTVQIQVCGGAMNVSPYLPLSALAIG
jgi:hypothetical protein